MIYPLNQLLRNSSKWRWTEECEKAFTEAKKQLMEPSVLAHYDSDLPLRLAADASPYGVGAVTSHILSDESEHPITYTSCTLSGSEVNYSRFTFRSRRKLGIKKLRHWNASGCILVGKHVSGDKLRVSRDVATIYIVLCLSIASFYIIIPFLRLCLKESE